MTSKPGEERPTVEQLKEAVEQQLAQLHEEFGAYLQAVESADVHRREAKAQLQRAAHWDVTIAQCEGAVIKVLEQCDFDNLQISLNYLSLVRRGVKAIDEAIAADVLDLGASPQGAGGDDSGIDLARDE